MFTGIIEQVGRLTSTCETRHGRELTIQCALSSELSIGQSIAINGTCLSVTDCFNDTFNVMAVPETISKTTLGQIEPNTLLNLERAMMLNSRLDGHLVQGHIDTIVEITRVSQQKDSRIYELLIPDQFSKFIVPRGSITIDGISLTIADISDQSTISIAIIPHTYGHTNVASWHVGTSCNIEFDILGKYVAQHIIVHR
ncbi:MAG: riboflavin synthase [Bacteroidetes bacterium]|nr:riboflavin synthase [Bacteroidota bacterium]